METRRYAMLVRVSGFGSKHRERFPDGSVGGQAFAGVDDAVAKLKTHAVSKMSSLREGSRAKAAARRALVDQLTVIGRTARSIAADSPGFDDSFRLPRTMTDESLLTAGRVFAHDAEAARDPLVAHGLAPTFIAELQAVVDGFEEAVRAREASANARIAAQTHIEEALLAGLAAVRKLDVLVANHFAKDPATLAVWARDRRVDYSSRKRSTGATAVEPDAATVVKPAQARAEMGANGQPNPNASQAALKVA